jgi:hypothetical protein
LVAGVVGVLAGAIVGRAFPPFVIDNPFWRAFLTSAGLGGVAAFLAAVVAFAGVAYSARRIAESARHDREQRMLVEVREHFWTRFTWAAERAVDPSEAELGLRVLTELIDQKWVTIEDNEVAVAVSNVILSSSDEDEGNAITGGGVK